MGEKTDLNKAAFGGKSEILFQFFKGVAIENASLKHQEGKVTELVAIITKLELQIIALRKQILDNSYNLNLDIINNIATELKTMRSEIEHTLCVNVNVDEIAQKLGKMAAQIEFHNKKLAELEAARATATANNKASSDEDMVVITDTATAISSDTPLDSTVYEEDKQLKLDGLNFKYF